MGTTNSTNRPPQRPEPLTYPGQRAQMARNPNWQPPPSRTETPARAPLAATAVSGPGAYSISRNPQGPMQVFRVIVPSNVSPNQEFQVYAGNRIVRVRCPPNTRPGQAVQITVPPEDRVTHASQNMAVLTSAEGDGGGGAVRMNSETRLVNASSSTDGSNGNTNTTPTPQAYNVVIPPNVRPGQTFPVLVNGEMNHFNYFFVSSFLQ